MAEELQETSQEESAENIDSTNDEEVAEESTDDSTDNTPTLEDYNALQKKNKELFERAKKAEAQAKVAKSTPIIKEIKETPTGLTREEAILIAKGVNEDVINQAAIVAKAKGINIKEAMKDPLIEAYASKIKADEKSEKAQLRASQSGGSGTDNRDLSQRVGMTEEEHKKAIGM